jgi:hypothetical protein
MTVTGHRMVLDSVTVTSTLDNHGTRKKPKKKQDLTTSLRTILSNCEDFKLEKLKLECIVEELGGTCQMNVHARIGTLTSCDGNRENVHSFFFNTRRESYVAHVLGSEFVQKSRLYVLEMRSLFRRSFLLIYSSDVISAVSRFGFTNRTQ